MQEERMQTSKINYENYNNFTYYKEDMSIHISKVQYNCTDVLLIGIS